MRDSAEAVVLLDERLKMPPFPPIDSCGEHPTVNRQEAPSSHSDVATERVRIDIEGLFTEQSYKIIV